MLERAILVCMIVGVTGCVSSVADVPAVHDQPASGDTIYILAAGTRDHPLAARGAWSTAAEVAADLEAAGFVPAVVLDPAEVPSSSPTVESILPGGECFSHAFLPVLTLGVIPELGCREYGHRFQLRCRGAGPTVEVNARFRVRSYVGWFVWPLALSSNWVHDRQGPPTNRREEVLYLKEQLREALQGSACAAQQGAAADGQQLVPFEVGSLLAFNLGGSAIFGGAVVRS